MEKCAVLVIGDAMIDAFLAIHEASSHCRIDAQNHQLCVNYGEKIPVESCNFLLGGIACNVAVGLSRIGYKTVLCAEIGDDEFSQKIFHDLQKETVDTGLIKQTKGAAASFAVGINFKGERTLFVEHTKREHAFDIDKIETEWIYLAGLGHEWKTPYRNVLQFVREKKTKLAFALGSLQLDEGGELIPEVIRETEILFA